MSLRRVVNLNTLGALFLSGAFVLSLMQVINVDRRNRVGPDGRARRIVRIAHWQLEPGYREAMEQVITAYNNLPHVKAAGVEVRQSPVTEKVYNQWINVNLMSGTAPDISERGSARHAVGQFTAKYFEPLDELVNEPNPYNAPSYLPEGLDPALARQLSAGPWRESFIDGMRGGWADDLQSYFAVPTSFVGTVRLFYNRTLMARAKALIVEAMEQSPRPGWYDAFMREGYLPESADLRRWASDESPPPTLGRLLLVCEAVHELARRTGNDKLVPIAGSSYSKGIFAYGFITPFTASYVDKLDVDLNSTVTFMETYAGWQRGAWSFDDAAVRAMYECIAAICRQFPPGFLALERDQANNRFILGNAVMIASGAWDAASLFHGAQARSRPEDRFEVGIFDIPLPGAGEKWSQYVVGKVNEAQTTAGAPFQVFHRSRNKRWAIDFLQYLSSYSVNQTFNRAAGWIPVVVGATPTRQMMPFMPDPAGIFGGAGFSLESPGSSIQTIYEGQLWLYMSGEVSFDMFVSRMVEAMNDRRSGLARLWHARSEQDRISHRNIDRMLAVHDAALLMRDDPMAAQRYRRTLEKSVQAFGGTATQALWRDLFPDQPFPAF